MGVRDDYDFTPSAGELHANGDCAGSCRFCDQEDDRLRLDHEDGTHTTDPTDACDECRLTAVAHADGDHDDPEDWDPLCPQCFLNGNPAGPGPAPDHRYLRGEI